VFDAGIRHNILPFKLGGAACGMQRQILHLQTQVRELRGEA
jgi:hypothetical protein